MPPTTHESTVAAPALSPLLQALYAPIAAELAEAEDVFRREMRSRHEGVDELTRYGVMLGGKRLRPALLLLAAKATGEVRREHIVLAAVVEMIHTATLVHDDVLDEASLRRHMATVNSRWGAEASVLLGDYLFTHAFYLSSTLKTTFACRMIGRATNVVCEGELRQVHSRGNFQLSEREYLEIVEAKTAELCACSCLLGAQYAGAAKPVVKRLSRFGRHLGIAFQMADDLLDLTGEERSTGKSLGTDLVKQKATLPLIRALQLASPAERAQLLELLQSEDGQRVEVLRPWLVRFGALEYAREQAARHSHLAQAQLNSLAASPARNVLSQMAEFAISRPH